MANRHKATVERKLEQHLRRLLGPIELKVRDMTAEELVELKAAPADPRLAALTNERLAARTAVIVDRELRRRGL
ncbi:MAG: hypothetical protein WD651_06610 [Acidimicrobiia bacterium]